MFRRAIAACGRIANVVDLMHQSRRRFAHRPDPNTAQARIPWSPIVAGFAVAGAVAVGAGTGQILWPVVLLLVAAILLVGWASGYLPFKAATSRGTGETDGLTAPVVLRVTGLVPTYDGGVRALAKTARLEVTRPSSQTLAWSEEAGEPREAVTMTWFDLDSDRSFNIVPGVSEACIGTAFAVTGTSPAIRVRYENYRWILAFDSERSRDEAFDSIRAIAPLIVGAGGASARQS
jgi:hypothetical protein